MKLRNELVFNDTFARAFGSLLKLAFPATVSLQILETFKAFNEQQKNVFSVRDSLLDRLAEKDANNKLVRIGEGVKFRDQESEKEFFDEMNKLLQLEFEIPLKKKLTLDDKIQISGEDLLVLQPVLDINI